MKINEFDENDKVSYVYKINNGDKKCVLIELINNTILEIHKENDNRDDKLCFTVLKNY